MSSNGEKNIVIDDKKEEKCTILEKWLFDILF